ncbi:MAG: pyrroline-5-carboxylate reductase [Ruminococcaceae bacterium]|nr:pyrroline-5-carboxylate reductase [Oscillospiraceae bacterium]
MATAIIGGMLNSNFTSADCINIFDLNKDKCNDFISQGVTFCSSADEVAVDSDVIVLAVKPQTYPDILGDLSKIDCENKVFVSIAAGISIAFIRKQLSQNVKVVRVMPNTPLLLSKGASAMCKSDNTEDDEFNVVKNMFSLSGVVEIIDESHMDEIISVNGSSPAYIYLFTKSIIDYAVESGIDEKKALNLICATLEGSAAMMRESGDDIDTLIKKVSSPGGTTIAALNSFEENNFTDIMKKAMNACANRAKELGK